MSQPTQEQEELERDVKLTGKDHPRYVQASLANLKASSDIVLFSRVFSRKSHLLAAKTDCQRW